MARNRLVSAFLILSQLCLPTGATANPQQPGARCIRLEPGQVSVVEGFRGTQVYPKFTLQRKTERDYVAWVDLHFTNAKGEEKPRLTRKFESLVRRCYARASTKLTGPEGQTLTLKIWKDAPPELAPQRPPVNEIAITRNWFFRSNSAEWEIGADCPLVIHESLHLLGLVDEYVETDRNPGRSNRLYDCRAHGPETSVMSDQGFAFTVVDLNFVGKLVPGQERESLLFPGQFKAIVEPGCTDRNALYHACARNAYVTADSNGRCPEMPRECETSDWVLAGAGGDQRSQE